MSCQEYQFIRNPISDNEASYLWGHYTKVIDIPFSKTLHTVFLWSLRS